MEIRCPICNGVPNLDQRNNKYAGYQLYCCSYCDHRFTPEAYGEVDYNIIYSQEDYAFYVDSIAKDRTKNKVLKDYVWLNSFFDTVHVNKGMNLLDVGCGVGLFCHLAYEKGMNVTGIDISKTAIEVGRKYAHFPMLNHSVTDMLDFGMTYDIITAFEIFEHLSDPVVLLKQMKKLLSPGGKIFLTVPRWNSKSQYMAKEPWVTPPLHVQFYSEKSLYQLSQNAELPNCNIKILYWPIYLNQRTSFPRYLLKKIVSLIRVRNKFFFGGGLSLYYND